MKRHVKKDINYRSTECTEAFHIPCVCDFKSIRILLVEDDRVNQIIASKFLLNLGVTVDTANNGKEGLEMIQSKSYQLVLMDVQMPVMCGYESVQSIRRLDNPYFKEVPIIALTASAMQSVRDKALEVGMNDYVCKPFVPAELHAKIRSFVFHRKAISKEVLA